MNAKAYKTVTCPKCNGRGIMREFAATYDGVCFKCNGATVIRVRDYTEAEQAKIDARKAKKAEAQAQKIREEFALSREADAEMIQARQIQAAAFKFIDANVGDDVELEGTVSYTRTVETKYGTSLLVVVRVDFEHEVKMFTTANWAWSVSRGERVSIRGAVKSFDEYEGKKATQLARVKAA